MAVSADRGGIVNLCKMLHEENGLFPLSEPRLNIMLDRAFDKSGAIIGVIGDVGEPVASIYLGLNQVVYSDAWTLMEEWNFVHPNFRRTDYAKSLLGYAKKASDEMKLPLLTGILSNQRTEAKIRLYERQLEKAGAYFVYNRSYAGPSAWDAASDPKKDEKEDHHSPARASEENSK